MTKKRVILCLNSGSGSYYILTSNHLNAATHFLREEIAFKLLDDMFFLIYVDLYQSTIKESFLIAYRNRKLN